MEISKNNFKLFLTSIASKIMKHLIDNHTGT